MDKNKKIVPRFGAEKKARDIDALVGSVQSWLDRTFVYVKKTEVRSLHGFIAIAFVVGIIVTVVMIVNYNVQTKSNAGTAGTATLKWNANTESDLAGYKIYYGTTARTGSCPQGGYANVVDAKKVTSYTFSNLTEGQTYYFSLTAYDASGNESCFSAQVSKLIPVVNTTCTSFTYSSWGTCQASGTQTRTVMTSSPSGCTGGSPVLSQTCTPAPVVCTSFNYSAWGECQATNTQTRTVTSSSPSGCTGGSPILSQSCAPSSGDTTAPVITFKYPTSTLRYGTDEVTAKIGTNENAVCKYSTTSGTSYDSMTRIPNTGKTAHSATIPGLSNGRTYTYYVLCRDRAGNTSEEFKFSFSVASSRSR